MNDDPTPVVTPEATTTRGRKPKSASVRTERRNRTGSLGGLVSKLALPEALKDDKDHRYRWFNDVGNNVNDQMQYNEWDLVDNKDYSAGSNMGKAISKRVGTGQDGQPLVAYLMKKPLAFSNEDRAKGQTAIDEKMNQIRKGARGTGSGELQSHGYDPSDGVRLRG